MKEKLDEVFANGATDTYEKEYLRKDGSRVPVLVGSAMGSIGTGQGIAFVLDITDRRIVEESRNARTAALQREVDAQTDELRRRAAELEVAAIRLARANRELEAFTYSVSHDLRAPLRAMEGFSRILIDEGAGTLTAKGRDYLQRIRRATERMSQLIDDLLSLSRVGRHKLEVREVDLSALVKTIADEFRSAEPSRNVEFVIPAGIFGPADPSVLRIALHNLIGNAWKFTSRHEAARIEFGVTDLEGERTYFIRDDGAGFDPAYAEKLFTPFQRLHSAVEFEGTGIGLALVERIISRHGGSVRAEGDVERGATVSFTLQTGAKGRGHAE
jgi:light-regulated signal transduction histidine kinase (bacteriophytochrome)